jgi:hypothetical protein
MIQKNFYSLQENELKKCVKHFGVGRREQDIRV